MSSPQYRAILLFGAPGAGKGTQGKVLGQLPGFCHLACGEVFRSLNMNTPDGRDVYQSSSKGELAPDDLTIRIWKKGLEGKIATSQYKPDEDLLVLDGIPRNLAQAKAMEGYLDVLSVIYLVCLDEEEMVDRMKRRAIRENRADDANEEVIRRRFEVYRDESEPVLGYYPEEIIHRIDAIGSPTQVLYHVLEALIPVQQAIYADQS